MNIHGDLHGKVYMVQLEGFAGKEKKHMVCKLKKNLYGLKQLPTKWYHKFDAFIQSQGFRRSEIDHCLYTKKTKDGSLTLLLLYVDDMLLASKNTYELDAPGGWACRTRRKCPWSFRYGRASFLMFWDLQVLLWCLVLVVS